MGKEDRELDHEMGTMRGGMFEAWNGGVAQDGGRWQSEIRGRR